MGEIPIFDNTDITLIQSSYLASSIAQLCYEKYVPVNVLE